MGIEGGCAALRRAGLAEDVPWGALALALWAWAVPGVEPRCSAATAAQIDRSGAQLARVAGRQVAVDALADRIEALAADPATGKAAGFDPLTGDQVHTIRYVALGLRAQARAQRRWAMSRPERPKDDIRHQTYGSRQAALDHIADERRRRRGAQ